MLTVYKASAGSGKTFQLVASCLKLLLKDHNNYRQILAVTFTNKATAEMKSRILQQLHILASGSKSAYTDMLTSELSLAETVIRGRAGQVLKNILHDYSRFSVSTIDSFTQRVIRSFNHEIGISPQLMLELNNDMVLEEAVGRLLAKVDTDIQLRRWLVEFSAEKIRENRSQQIESDIKALGKELFREKFQVFFPEGDDSVYNRENLENFRKELQQIVGVFKNTMKKKAADCMQLMGNAGFSTADFLYKETGVAGYLKCISENVIKEPGARVLDVLGSADKWFAKTHPEKEQLRQLTEKELQPRLADLLSFYENNLLQHNSAVEVIKQLRMLGILSDLKEEITRLLHEKGMMLISDSNLLLKKIIAGSDSPFIYEKMGSRYSYYMLDEFQDTSGLQWENFRPLIADALSEGHETLLVGDVKQSIYRWRNSDWNILASRITTDFAQHPPREVSLDKNWRSCRNIIRFNNATIGALKQLFLDRLPGEEEKELFESRLNGLYSSYEQEPGHSSAGDEGLVEVNFLPEEEFDQHSSQLLVEQVKRLQDKGMKASDIAILIRKNSEGAGIVETFLDAARREENSAYNLSVISGESLFLYASKGVNFVILVIEWLKDPENKIWKIALLQLWFSWLKPLVHPAYPAPVPGDEPEWLNDGSGENLFQAELETRLLEIKTRTLLLSLDEIIMEISSRFGLFELQSELPFLQTLTDKAAELKISLSNDLSGFLLWWNEQGYETSVNVNEEVDAVRLLTVHKSKGLEFGAVLLPFFNWDTSWTGNQARILWCTPSAGPFNRFPLLPVKAGSALAKTIFRDDYFEEKMNSHIDTLNLIYVAFTRAKSVLFVNCKKYEDKKGRQPGKTVNVLLEDALNLLVKENKLQAFPHNDGNTYTFGKMPVVTGGGVTFQTGWINKYQYNGFGSRIRLRTDSENITMAGEGKTVRSTGNIVHEILAGITQASDVERACRKAFLEGKINAGEQQQIMQIIGDSLLNPVIGRWFSGDYTVLNERMILSDGKVLRPDRIMISGKQAIVVDYKWGDIKQDSYIKQVRNYSAHLLQCGFEKVEGYIWYINSGEVVEVKDLMASV